MNGLAKRVVGILFLALLLVSCAGDKNLNGKWVAFQTSEPGQPVEPMAKDQLLVFEFTESAGRLWRGDGTTKPDGNAKLVETCKALQPYEISENEDHLSLHAIAGCAEKSLSMPSLEEDSFSILVEGVTIYFKRISEEEFNELIS